MRNSDLTGVCPDSRVPEGRPTGPAVPRMVLGARLRRLREAQHISREEAGGAIRASAAGISRLELGRVGASQRDVADLLTIYGVADAAERVLLLELAAQAGAAGWWRRYADIVPGWLEPYLSLEQSASVIRGYEVQFVPGLLQTREYARAVIGLGRPDVPPEQLQRRVELRVRRQRVLYDAQGPRFWAVVDEAALRRPVGGPETMRAQLRHLIAACSLPRVSLQVIPFDAGAHAAAGGPITLVRLPGDDLPDVVYLEQLIGGHYPDDADDIEYYRQVIDYLVTAARPPEETPGILRRLLAETGGAPAAAEAELSVARSAGGG
ncbi:XRE family transcriptional regulator [Streptomyces sp. AJS327]|uniref:helix-turn-helix domain-containing protein n=1 Tax=Streptomyces sp. AJS327 TaxID=2545265 RepID=UPI0015DDCF23|nr:helix-turn-helix transcriptional regulator [Streptomyces sp. AJS327]MBA0052327.1 XRE family transcriptional regulator [Streptomyces sp. AJS327]